MTYLMIEDALSDAEELAQKTGLTVKCSWCGEIGVGILECCYFHNSFKETYNKATPAANK